MCNVLVNYHQSSFHFIRNTSSIQLPFIWKKLLLSIQLLFDERNIFHRWNFYLSKDKFSWIQLLLQKQLFSSIQLLLNRKLNFIHPASIYGKNYFDQSNFKFEHRNVFINPTSI